HGARQRVIAALDLPVTLAPGELDVQLLSISKPERRGGCGLRDCGQEQFRGLGDPRAPEPLRHRLVVTGASTVDCNSQLPDELSRRFAFETPAAEDQVGDVGPETEIFRELQVVLFTEAGDVVLSVVDDLGANVRE